jgi:hypothetical protein
MMAANEGNGRLREIERVGGPAVFGGVAAEAVRRAETVRSQITEERCTNAVFACRKRHSRPHQALRLAIS